MDKIFDEKLHNVETALNAVISSTTQYNPSPADAEKLLQAGDELDSAIQELITHQENHSRILQLQELEKKLDEQIKATVRLLADTRHELKAARFTEFSRDARPVPFDKLLRYAQNISKFTIPPTGALTTLQQPAENQTDNEHGDDAAADGNALQQGTPAAQVDDAKDTVEGYTLNGHDTDWKNSGWQNLSEPQKAWMNSKNEQYFFPWPREDVIARGALSAIQGIGSDAYKQEVLAEEDDDEPLQESVPMDEDGDDYMNGGGEVSRHSISSRPKAPEVKFEGFNFSED